MDTVSDVSDLYGLPRDEFVPARRDLAKRLRADGDSAAATRVEKLPKPTTAAWLVNTLVRRDPGLIDDLADLGAELREAHAKADGARLRDLAKRRAALLGSLIAAAGDDLSEPITRELADMFTTAIADEKAAETLRAGRLASVRDLAVEDTWPGLSIAPSTTAKPEAKPKARRSALAEAKAAVKEAEAQRTEADRAVSAAEEAVTQAEDRVRELNAALDEAEHAELEARRTLQTARRDAKSAERTAGLAWRRLQQVEAD